MRSTTLAAVLFDLDGTLIDSVELILCSYAHALATRPFSSMRSVRERTVAGMA